MAAIQLKACCSSCGFTTPSGLTFINYIRGADGVRHFNWRTEREAFTIVGVNYDEYVSATANPDPVRETRNSPPGRITPHEWDLLSEVARRIRFVEEADLRLAAATLTADYYHCAACNAVVALDSDDDARICECGSARLTSFSTLGKCPRCPDGEISVEYEDLEIS